MRSFDSGQRHGPSDPAESASRKRSALSAARYDGLAEWYDREFANGELAHVPREAALRLLGEPTGKLLDIGCGTGTHTAAMSEHGWSVTGADISADLLRIARERGVEAVLVLRLSGLFVYVGAHPCFIGPHSRFLGAEGVPELHAGYRRTERYTEGPAIRPTGLRAKVGATHLPLGLFLQTFLDAGLRLEWFEELETWEYPYTVALRWRRT
jgi:SAM-dependent methyltransferase